MPDRQEPSSVPPVARPTPRKVSRMTKMVLTLLGLLVAIPAIALVILLNYDWNKARPWLNAKASEALGRPFAINGDLSLQWEKPASKISGQDSTWRDHIPWPHLIANDVHVSNPAGMPARDSASVSQMSFSLNPFSLLHKTIAIPVLRFQTPKIDLLRNADGLNNWTFDRDEKKSPWKLDLERVVFTKGVVHLADAVEKVDVTADVDTIDNKTYGISWKLRGTYHGAPVTGGGKAGAVLSLKESSVPYPVQADFRAGATHASAEGTITRPSKLAAIDLKLKMSGASMARLYDFTGVLLPETPAFTTEGRLIGTLDEKSSRWTYDKFKGKVGSSDLGGRLEFQTGKPRGMLTGTVVSKELNFADLGPIIGADSNASKTARGVAPVQPSGKVLPVETFRTERWKKVDADVKYSADRIVREKQLPISKLSTHVVMKAGVLTLNPLNFTMAG
ncbi:MAG: AsmA family protein, partial [Telluria sp.]